MPHFADSRVEHLYQSLTAEASTVALTPSSTLGELVMHVSEGCNLGCSYCFADEGKYGAETSAFMKPEDAYQSIVAAGQQYEQVEKIKFFDSEPLMNLPAIRAAHTAAVELVQSETWSRLPLNTAVSNMTIFNEHAIAVINELNIQVTGSIDGPQAVNDIFRVYSDGRGSWGQIDEGIRTLREATGQPRCLEVVYGPHHLRLGYSMVDIHDFLIERYGVDAVVLHPMSPEPKVADDPYWTEFAEQIHGLAHAYGRHLATTTQRRSSAESIVRLLSDLRRERIPDAHCSLGVNTLTCTSDGVVYPCYTLIGQPEFVMLPDIRMRSSEDDENFQDVQDAFTDNRKSNVPECRDCDIRLTCQACPGSMQHASGEINSPIHQECDFRIGHVEGMLSGIVDASGSVESWKELTRSLSGVETYESSIVSAC